MIVPSPATAQKVFHHLMKNPGSLKGLSIRKRVFRLLSDGQIYTNVEIRRLCGIKSQSDAGRRAREIRELSAYGLRVKPLGGQGNQGVFTYQIYVPSAAEKAQAKVYKSKTPKQLMAIIAQKDSKIAKLEAENKILKSKPVKSKHTLH